MISEVDNSHSSSQVLQNFDLLELILEHFGSASEDVLSPSYHGYVGPRTKQCLLRACLTTRSFMGPAINILWRHMSSVSPILNLIPNLYRQEDGSYVSMINILNTRWISCRIKDLIGPIEDAGIQSILFYTRKIRVYHLEREDLPISSGTLRKIIDQLKNMETFSSLQHSIIWFNQLDEKQFMLQSLLSDSSPNLCSLHLKTFPPCSAATALSFLCASPNPQQSLQTLHLTGNFLDIGPFPPALTQLTNLCHLHLTAVASFIPPWFLQGCASSMASLETLKIYLCSEVEDESLETSYHDLATFDLLKSLELGGFSKSIGGMMNMICAPLLDTIILYTSCGQLPDLRDSISKFISLHEKITKLSISFESPKVEIALCLEDISLAKIQTAYDASILKTASATSFDWSRSVVISTGVKQAGEISFV